MKKSALKLLPYIIPVLLTAIVSSCKKDIINNTQNTSAATNKTLKVNALGKYDNGFFLINEGWYGHGTGTVSFYDYGTGVLSDSLFTKENPGKNLNPNTSTLQYGTIFNDKLFLVSKVGGPFVIT